MILKGLRIENVKCFEDVDLTFVPGKNVIIGHNGSGKSTILQSILYSLFHDYPQGKVDGLIRHGARSAEFELEFEHEGKQYLVERTLRKSGKQDAQLSEVGLPDSLADTQTGVTHAVSETLETRKEVFRDVILVRQGEIAQIVDMSSSDRKVLFDKLLGIHDYAQAWNQCRPLNNTLQTKLSRSKEIMELHKPTADKLLERKIKLKKLGDERKEKRKLLSKFRSIRKDVKAEWNILDKLERQIRTLDTQIESLRTNLDDSKEKRKGRKKKFDGLCAKLQVTKPAKLATLLMRLEKEESELKKGIMNKRRAHQALLDEEGNLTRNLENAEDLADEITGFDEENCRMELDAVSKYPDLKELAHEDWPGKIDQEIKTMSEELRKVKNELKKVEGIQRSIDTLTVRVQNHQENITSFQAAISRNEKAAKATGGADWRSLAKLSKSKTESQLEKASLQLKNAESQEKKRSREVSQAESVVDRLNEELDGLSALVGKVCPKCKQVVDEEHAAKLESETKGKLTEAKKLLTGAKKRQERAEKHYETQKAKVKDLEKNISQIEKLSIYLNTEIDSTTEIRRINPKLKKAKGTFEDKKAELSKYDALGLRKKEVRLGNWLDTLKELKGDVRTFLKDNKTKQRKNDALKALNAGIEKLQALSLEIKIPALHKLIQSMEIRRDQLQDLINVTRGLKELEEQIGGWVAVLKKKDRQLDQAKKQFSKERYDELTVAYDEVKSAITRLQTQVCDLTEHRIPEALEAYDDSKDSAKAIEEKQYDHERTTQAIEVLAKMREFYREVQIPLRARDVRRASSHATEVFKSLMGTNEFDRVMITDNHDLLVSRFGELEPMRAISGGEQVLAALAVRLGFAQALVGSDLLILDEPTAYLDDIRRAELVQTLTYASPAKQMLIVTHDDDFKSMAQKIIRVQKDDSTLVSNVSIEE